MSNLIRTHCTVVVQRALLHLAKNVILLLLQASGDCSWLVYVWNPDNLQRLGVLRGHRNSILVGLRFAQQNAVHETRFDMGAQLHCHTDAARAHSIHYVHFLSVLHECSYCKIET